MIDVHTEKVIPFGKVPEHIPGRPHFSQVYRWSMRGLRGCKLEWIKIGGRRFTSLEALDRFYRALTIADGGEAAPMPTPKARKRQIAAAEHELSAAGFTIGGDA
jgi:hypothetical protein